MKRWGDIISGIGTVILSLLSCASCPLCLPFYAGLLSLIGFDLIDVHTLLFPLTIAFAIITLGFMAYHSYSHQGPWKPLKIAVATVFGMIGAAYYGYEYPLYIFLFFFMGCVLWNKKLKYQEGRKCC